MQQHERRTAPGLTVRDTKSGYVNLSSIHIHLPDDGTKTLNPGRWFKATRKSSKLVFEQDRDFSVLFELETQIYCEQHRT
jgi:hypothetical protein